MNTWYAIMENLETGKLFKVPLVGAYFIEEAVEQVILNTQIYGDTCMVRELKRGNYFKEVLRNG